MCPYPATRLSTASSGGVASVAKVGFQHFAIPRHLRGRSVCDDLAVVQDDDPVRHRHDELDRVLDEDDGDPFLPHQPADDAEQLLADGRRQPDGVEHFIDTSSSDMCEAVLELTDGRGADLVLDTVGGALFEPALRSLRFDGRIVGLHGGPEPIKFDLNEIYNRQLHVTGLASVFLDGADVARIFDQLRPLFDRGLLLPPAVKTWPLNKCVEAYQTVLDGSAGIKQVLLPISVEASVSRLTR